MRGFYLLLLVAVVMALGLMMSPTPQASRYGTALGTTTAQADDDAIPLPIKPRPGTDPACGRVCLVSATGAHYCGTGAGVVGCKSIVLNNCIYTLCAP